MPQKPGVLQCPSNVRSMLNSEAPLSIPASASSLPRYRSSDGGSEKEENFSLSCNYYLGAPLLSFPLEVFFGIILIGDWFHS